MSAQPQFLQPGGVVPVGREEGLGFGVLGSAWKGQIPTFRITPNAQLSPYRRAGPRSLKPELTNRTQILLPFTPALSRRPAGEGARTPPT